MDPLPEAEFALLLAQAGLSLPEEEQEDLRHAHAKLRGMLGLLREPPPSLEAEPAFAFTPGGEG